MVAPGAVLVEIARPGVSPGPRRVTVVEVGPRDGLQNESRRAQRRRPGGLLRRARWRRACRWSRSGPSCRRSGCRRWPAPTRCSARVAQAGRASAAGARPEPRGLRGALGGRRARDRRLHRRQRDLQPQEHQRLDRRVVRALRARSCREARARGSARARLRLDLLRLPLRGPGRPGARGRVARRLPRSACDEISIGDTIGVGVPTQVAGRDGRAAASGPGRGARGPLPRHARHRARERAGGAAGGRHDRRQLGRRARRLPLRAGRRGQPRDRGPALHAARDGHRDRRRPRAWSRPPRGRWCARLGHALPARYLQAWPPVARAPRR